MSITQETRNGYKIGDSYVHLLERFPLWKIQSEGQYDRATGVLQDLIGRKDLDADESAYIDALVILVEEYESRQYPLDKLASARKPLDVLRHLIDSNGMTRAELAKLLGVGPSSVSMILSGDRPITLGKKRGTIHGWTGNNTSSGCQV